MFSPISNIRLKLTYIWAVVPRAVIHRGCASCGFPNRNIPTKITGIYSQPLSGLSTKDAGDRVVLVSAAPAPFCPHARFRRPPHVQSDSVFATGQSLPETQARNKLGERDDAFSETLPRPRDAAGCRCAIEHRARPRRTCLHRIRR